MNPFELHPKIPKMEKPVGMKTQLFCVEIETDLRDPSTYCHAFHWYESIEKARRRVQVLSGVGYFKANSGENYKVPSIVFRETPYENIKACIWQFDVAYTNAVELGLIMSHHGTLPYQMGKIVEVYDENGDPQQCVRDGKFIGDKYIPENWQPETPNEQYLACRFLKQ